MKTLKPLLGGLFMALCFSACNSAEQRSESSASTGATSEIAADAAMDMASAMADSATIPQENRKIIKTADIRGRVTDVLQSSRNLESQAKQLGGQVVHSEMRNNIENVRQQRISNDSLKEIQSYTTTSNLTFKIPVQFLDSFLNNVEDRLQFVNNSSLSLDDVSLAFLSNKLKQQANERDNLKGKNVDEVGYIDAKRENNIDRKIENLGINDRVKYATLTLEIYQPQRADVQIVTNVDHLIQPTFGEQLSLALANGWDLVKILFIGLANIWALLLIAAAVILLIKRKSWVLVKK